VILKQSDLVLKTDQIACYCNIFHAPS